MELARRGRSKVAAWAKAEAKKKRQADRKAADKRRAENRKMRAAKLAILEHERALAKEALRTVKRQQAAIRAAQTRADRRRAGLGPKRSYRRPSCSLSS